MSDSAIEQGAAVANNENPFRLSYWFGSVDPRPLALFRILFGLTLCHDLLNYAPNLGAFATDQGMLPRALARGRGVWSLFNLVGSNTGAGLLFAVGLCFVVSFTLGYRTRLSTALSWLFLTSLHTRNLYVTDGGDDLARYLLFLSVFADLGGYWSLDCRFGRRPTRLVPILGLRFLQLHIVLLYFCAARLKFRAGWLTHNIVYECLQLTGFVRPPGHLLLAWPNLCFGLTLMTLALEWSFAFLALSPVRVGSCRALAIAAGTAVQLGILFTMRVGVFTEAMLAAMALFTRPEWFDWIKGKLGRGFVPTNFAALEPQARQKPSFAELALFGFLAFNLISLAWGPFIARRIPPPQWVMAERRWLWLDQPFGLFDVVYQVPRWRADGIEADGSAVEALYPAIPDLEPQLRWRFSRWYKFTFKERERPFHFDTLGDYVCRSYRNNTSRALREFSLIEELTPPRLPGEPPARSHARTRWHQVCRE